jgi:hypothetical protein
VPWEALIIPLIALAVWILGAIFRGGEQQQQERERRPRSGAEGGRPRGPRRPTSELDRFLEEARARRKPAAPPVETERPRPEPVILEAVPVETPPEKPPERPRPSPERRPKPRPPVTTPPVAPAVRVPVAQPIAMPAAVAPAPPPPAPVMERRTPTQNPEAERAPALAMSVPTTQPRRTSALGLKLLEMLRDKQSLATAVMLREIFDRPVAMRRHQSRQGE